MSQARRYCDVRRAADRGLNLSLEDGARSTGARSRSRITSPSDLNASAANPDARRYRSPRR